MIYLIKRLTLLLFACLLISFSAFSTEIIGCPPSNHQCGNISIETIVEPPIYDCVIVYDDEILHLVTGCPPSNHQCGHILALDEENQ